MTLRYRNVVVKEVPATINGPLVRSFIDQVTSCMSLDRPCLVFDCSKMVRIDSKTIHLLLSCLEEALKRNGDVRLAGISHDTKAVLERYGVDSLFQIFDSNAEAIKSFCLGPVSSPVHESRHIGSRHVSKESG